VSQLLKLVEFLDRDDVTEVVVATGRPVTLRMGGEYRPLGKNPASSAQVDALFAGSPVAQMVATGGGASLRMRLAERDCAVDVQVHGDQILVRLTRPRAPAPASSAGVAAAAPRPRAGGNSSGPVVVAAAPPPRIEPSGSGSFARPPDDDIGALLSRSSDGTSERAPVVATAPVGARRRPITMPPMALGSIPAIDPGLVERAAVPISGGGPAASRHSIVLPPADPGAAPPVVMPTSARQVPNAPRPAAPAALPAPAPTAALPAPAPTAALPAPGVPSYTPARRHTITAAPAVAALPPLVEGQAKAPPDLLAILVGARARNASDLHLTGDRPPMERTPRGLEAVGRPLAMADVERMLGALLSPSQKAQLDARGYVDAALDVEGAGRLRANISRFRGGVKGSFRLVLSAPPTLEQLGLPRELARVTSYHQGLVVIAGPNGHGKTTTLAALVDLINSQKPHHILTIEDPVEILHPRKRAVISQREVGNHTRSFAAALKASLREDPDVIVIGELRDRETVEIALTAAETGHLVMATMSTPSAAKSLDRLIDMFPPDDQQQVRMSLAAALRFVVAQRLLPTVDGAGAVAAVELLTGVLPLAALIRDNKLFQVPSLQQRGRSFGMIRLDDSLLELVRAGKISEDVAIRAADGKKDLTLALRGPAPAAPPPAARPAGDLKGRLGGLFGAGKKGAD